MTGVAVAGSPELRQLTDIFKDSIADITNTLVNSGYSRDLEFQADQMALDIMRRVGYDPARVRRHAEGHAEPGSTPGGLDFAKTHPDPRDRIAKVEGLLAGQPAVTASPAARAARQARYQAALKDL